MFRNKPLLFPRFRFHALSDRQDVRTILVFVEVSGDAQALFKGGTSLTSLTNPPSRPRRGAPRPSAHSELCWCGLVC